MSWTTILGVACMISLSLPIIVILYNRLYNHRSLAALLIYFLLALAFNLVSGEWVTASTDVKKYLGLITNYVDTPLMLVCLLFFCHNRQRQRVAHVLIALFICYEIIVTMIHGFNRTALVYILGPGVFIILAYTAYLFIRQVKFSVYHGKNGGRMIMLASILFNYTCFSLIYYFHYVQNTTYKEDTMTIYFISTFIASVSMAAGLHMMRKRMKELESLRVTRRELAMIFGR